jgi:hypothetical protein
MFLSCVSLLCQVGLIMTVFLLWRCPVKNGKIYYRTSKRSSDMTRTTWDTLPAGTFHSGDDIPAGTFHSGDDIPAGTFHSGDDIPAGTFH